MDDPRLDPVWEECGTLGHSGGHPHHAIPEAFFTPIDAHNERYEELIESHLELLWPAKFPSKETLLARAQPRIRKASAHQTFIALHVANWPENLDVVSAGSTNIPTWLWNSGLARLN